MKKSIALLEQGFESSCGLTPEFAQFFRTFKSEFTRELQTIGATDIVFSRGHFYVSGFFTVSGQAYYFSISDVRGSEYRMPQLMYRTAKHYKDYTGGQNRWVDIAPLMADKMCWYFKVVD
jgi:hypothetical protein